MKMWIMKSALCNKQNISPLNIGTLGTTVLGHGGSVKIPDEYLYFNLQHLNANFHIYIYIFMSSQCQLWRHSAYIWTFSSTFLIMWNAFYSTCRLWWHSWLLFSDCVVQTIISHKYRCEEGLIYYALMALDVCGWVVVCQWIFVVSSWTSLCSWQHFVIAW